MRQPWKQSMMGEVLHRYTEGLVYVPGNEEPVLDPFAVKDIFIFPYGCVVFWGCRLDEVFSTSPKYYRIFNNNVCMYICEWNKRNGHFWIECGNSRRMRCLNRSSKKAPMTWLSCSWLMKRTRMGGTLWRSNSWLLAPPSTTQPRTLLSWPMMWWVCRCEPVAYLCGYLFVYSCVTWRV